MLYRVRLLIFAALSIMYLSMTGWQIVSGQQKSILNLINQPND